MSIKGRSMRAMMLPLLLLLLASICYAQVEMREPPPRRSKFSKFYITADDVDYNMKSPLGGKISYPCRNNSPGPVQGTLVAGQDLKVFFDGTATRQGGDCQFAISYDNGTSFAVLWDKLDNCFLDTVNGGYEVPVPDRLPAAKSAVFAWAWIPKIGPRAYYMNCADVRVENYGKQQAYIGKELLVVNVPGKPKLDLAKSSEKDSLASMLDDRPQITVGEPSGPTDPTSTPDADNGDDDSSSGVDEQNGDDAKPQDDDEGSGTVVLYLSESTTTSTEIVYMTEYLTEDDTDYNALYTYGAGIQTRGQLSTTLGPYVKPLFGSNVGLTIDPDSTQPTSSSTEAIAKLSFTDDLVSPWPTGSAKWVGSESQDYIPPSLPGPQATPPSNSIDILMASSTRASQHNIGDAAYPAGTPLFSASLQSNVASLSTNGIHANPPLPLDPTMRSGTAATNTIATNRPSYRSVTDKANKEMLNHVHSSRAEQAPHATTVFSTVTMNGKPVLQVVVSMDSSAVPESLTIAY